MKKLKEYLWHRMFRKFFQKQLEDEIKIFLCRESKRIGEDINRRLSRKIDSIYLQQAFDENKIVGVKGSFYIDDQGNQYKM